MSGRFPEMRMTLLSCPDNDLSTAFGTFTAGGGEIFPDHRNTFLPIADHLAFSFDPDSRAARQWVMRTVNDSGRAEYLDRHGTLRLDGLPARLAISLDRERRLAGAVLPVARDHLLVDMDDRRHASTPWPRTKTGAFALSVHLVSVLKTK